MSDKTRDSRYKWTEEQETLIYQFYPKMGPKALAEQMGVGRVALESKAFCMGVKFESNRFEWTEEMINTLKERYKTEGPTKLSRELGVPYYELRGKAVRLGLGLMRQKTTKFEWTEETEQKLIDRYVSEGGEKLAQELGVRLDFVRKKASALGLHTVAGHKDGSHLEGGRKFAEQNTNVDVHYFDSWSQNMSYILGFLFVDGCMNKNLNCIGIGINSKDEAVLCFMKEQMKSKKEIRVRSNIKEKDLAGYKPRFYSSLTFYSSILCRRAAKLGLLPRKTYNDYPYQEVPDEMFPHFVRGVFDGDGTVSIRKDGGCCIGFIGAPKFIEGLTRSLIRLSGIRQSVVRIEKGKTTDYAVVSWASVTDLRLFRDFIYPDGFEFCLKRKKDKLDFWLSMGVEPQPRREFSKEEIQVLSSLYPILGLKKLSRILKREEYSLEMKLKELRIKTIEETVRENLALLGSQDFQKENGSVVDPFEDVTSWLDLEGELDCEC